METETRRILQALAHLNLVLRQQLEVAEAEIPLINQQLNRLGGLRLLPTTVVTGEVICRRAYSALAGPRDSGEVLQAALVVPGGLGIVCWDSEDYVAYCRSRQDESEVLPKFLPFDRCSPAEQALLLPHVRPLLVRLWLELDFASPRQGPR